MKNNDGLKKHHFWILAGLAPLFAVLSAVFLMTSAGGAASAALEEQKKKQDEINGVNPKGTQAIEDWGKQKQVLLAQREKLWQAAWEQQKTLFTWPGKEPLLKEMEKRYPKFGTPMVARNSEFDLFVKQDTYEASYTELANSIKPTLFKGGRWQSVLRHVSTWPKIPTDKQVWVALEDLWVQRGLLQPVNVINDEAGRFEPVGQPKKDPPYTAKFRNRIWDLDLEIVNLVEGSQKGDVFKVKLTNRTDRLQLLGRGNAMPLEVTLGGRGQPVLLRVQGDFVKAGETLDVKPELKNYRLPPGVSPTAITKVKMRLDGRTAPVRRVETVDVGYKDARHFPAVLKSPEWWPDPEPGADALAMGTGGMPGPMGDMAMPGGPPPGGGYPPGAMGGGTGRVAGAKVGPPQAVLDGNKARYLDVTKQVRRMPVAVVILVDQMFVQDALTAYSNSPLRFQITQFHWKRYRGGAGGDPSADMMGGMGSMDMGGDMSGYPMGGDGGMGMMPPGDPSGGMADMAAMMPPGGGRDGGESSDFGYSLPPSGFGGGYPGSGATTGSQLTEGQDTSGLVELTIYGVVTLYEMFEKEKPEGETPPPADGAPPADGDAPPADAAEAPAAPAPAETPKP